MLKRIPVADIYGNPDQPRKTFDPERLRELAASIRENGLQQPITVRADGAGKWMIVMGERRWRAHQLLAEQGFLTDMLCQVTKVDDAQLSINAIIENDQRVDVAPLEQARSYQRMIDVYGYDVPGLAKKLGKGENRIRDRLLLLNLDESLQQLLASDNLSVLQCYHMAELSKAGQMKLLRAIQAGHCPTPSSLKAAAAAIRAAEQQVAMFDDLPEPTDAERSTATGFERKVQAVAAMLNAGIDDNTVTAIRKVDPSRASTLADLLAAAAKDMKRIEDALRALAATQMEMEEAA